VLRTTWPYLYGGLVRIANGIFVLTVPSEPEIQVAMTGQGDIALRLAVIRKAAGLSGQDVADALSKLRGKDVPKSSYTHYESAKFKQDAIPLGLAQELAAIFEPKGIAKSELLALAGLAPGLINATSQDDRRPASSPDLQPDHRRATESANVVTEQENLPVYGYVAGKGEEEVFFIDQGHEMTRTLRPNILRGVTDAYAVDVYGDSMSPKYEPGNRLWVAPRRPYRAGDDVIIQLDGERAVIKRVVRKADKCLIVRQFAPAKEIKIAWSEIKQVDLVVGMLIVAT
jgi:phage repressor protein C with HTH and peptisase S24 domain